MSVDLIVELKTLSFHEMLVSALSQKSFSCAHVLIAIAMRFWISAVSFTVSVRRVPKYTACCLLGTMFPLWYLIVDNFLLGVRLMLFFPSADCEV